MSPAELVGLAASAAAAGVINAVAGGGTLLTFPTLLVFGTAPIVANATSSLALVVGTFGGVFGFRKQLGAVRAWLWRLLPPSLLGGGLGSWLLKSTSDKVFAKLVPFLILFATVLFLAQELIKRWTGKGAAESPAPAPGTVLGAVLFQFAVAVYGGYFGAGMGILMLASLGILGLSDIHQMNALKTVLASVINLVASAIFIHAGLIDWPRASVMTLGALAGYFVGSHYSQRISQARIRQVVTAVGLIIAAASFWKEFLR